MKRHTSHFSKPNFDLFMSVCPSLVFLLQIVSIVFADHYKGGSISWKPINPYSLVDPVPIIITHRHSWTFSRYPCNQSTINIFDTYNDTGSGVPATLTCISSSALCTASLYQTIDSPLFCTDFATEFDVSTGTLSVTQSLALNSTIDISWRGAAWSIDALTNQWSLVAHIDLTPVSGNKINTSPVTGSLPVIRLSLNRATNIQILVADWDSDQVVRCRWSYQSPIDECGDVCFNLPNATIKPQDCIISWNPVLRPDDIANGLNQSTYVIAITVEDFDDDFTTTAISSVPHQALVQVYIPPTGACPTLPYFWSAPRRNQACFGLTAGVFYTFNFYARVYCAGDSIVDFPSSAPLFMQKQNIIQIYNDTWMISFRYRPPANQTGVQPLCVGAIDNNGLSTIQYCLSLGVGAVATTFVQPTFVQGSASPVGTVMSTQRRFSIQANVAIKRPLRDGSQIRLYVRNFTALVWWVDTRYSPDVFYFNRTLVFYVRNFQWVLGETYSVVLLEGVATADQYCGMESPTFGIYSGNLFWRFTIWNPAMSSTTTPSTTTSTATTHTVTTRVLGTTTANPLFTTTGIPAFTILATTLTTATTSTSVTTVTTTSATTATTTTVTTTVYYPDASVLYPKDMERQCLQPVTIATALVTLAAIPLHFYAMINLFVKMNSHFQQDFLKMRHARRIRFAEPSAVHSEENQSFV